MNIKIEKILAALTDDNGITLKPDTDVYICGDSIAAIDEAPEGFVPDKTIDGTDRLLIPGLINAHTHSYMAFMRNVADDLSFEDFEVEYKYLKAVIEGGLESRPDNVLIYATSNRRHLIKETWNDTSDVDLEKHRGDTLQEKLSLVDRFGISIPYMKPNKKEFLEIVRSLAARNPDITLPEEELEKEAQKWEMSHGGFSGRTAQQFINYIAGKEAGKEAGKSQ